MPPPPASLIVADHGTLDVLSEHEDRFSADRAVERWKASGHRPYVTTLAAVRASRKRRALTTGSTWADGTRLAPPEPRRTDAPHSPDDATDRPRPRAVFVRLDDDEVAALDAQRRPGESRAACVRRVMCRPASEGADQG